MLLPLLLAVAAARSADPAADPAGYARADAELNAEYARAMALMRRRDRGGPFDDGDPTYAAALTAAQRAWLRFRDAECRLAGFEYRGGSAQRLSSGTCLATLTRDRTRQLRQLRRNLTPL